MKKEEGKVLLRIRDQTNLNNAFLKELTEGWEREAIFKPTWKKKGERRKKGGKVKRKPILSRPTQTTIDGLGWKSTFYQPRRKLMKERKETFFTTKIMFGKEQNGRVMPGLYGERYNKDGKMGAEEARQLYNRLASLPARVKELTTRMIAEGEARQRAKARYQKLLRNKEKVAKKELAKAIEHYKNIQNNNNEKSNKRKNRRTNKGAIVRFCDKTAIAGFSDKKNS